MELTLGATTRPWNKWSFAEACAGIAGCGYSDVAIFAHGGKVPVNAESTAEEAAEMKRTAVAAGLAPSMLITNARLDLPLDEAVADYNRVIDNAVAAGVTWVMNCGCGNPELFEKYNQVFAACSPHAEAAGARLVMKPHGGNGMTGKDMVRVVEAVNHPAFSICYDPGNIIYYSKGESRPETDIHDVKRHVSICIIKDCIVADGQPDVNILPGSGWVDFAQVLGALVNDGFTGPLYVECLGGTEWDDINGRGVRTREYIAGLVSNL